MRPPRRLHIPVPRVRRKPHLANRIYDPQRDIDLLAETLTSLINDDPLQLSLSYEQNYRAAYTLVLHGYGDDVHAFFVRVVRRARGVPPARRARFLKMAGDIALFVDGAYCPRARLPKISALAAAVM